MRPFGLTPFGYQMWACIEKMPKKGVTIRDIARGSGISKGHMSRLCHGHISIPRSLIQPLKEYLKINGIDGKTIEDVECSICFTNGYIFIPEISYGAVLRVAQEAKEWSKKKAQASQSQEELWFLMNRGKH